MSDIARQPYRVVLVTLFAEFFSGPLSTSLLGKAVEVGTLTISFVNPRDFTTDKHRTVDDTPYGGGPGMVLKPEPMVAAIEQARSLVPEAPVVLMTPQGARLNALGVTQLAKGAGLIIVCGRYEGFDERIRAFVDDELSIGDYVLTGGEPAALVVVDSVSRRLEGVLGNADSVTNESFADGLLEYPQYTRPSVFRGMGVPDVLVSGNHARIAKWRYEQALARTRDRRPDLFQLAESTDGSALPPLTTRTPGEASADPDE